MKDDDKERELGYIYLDINMLRVSSDWLELKLELCLRDVPPGLYWVYIHEKNDYVCNHVCNIYIYIHM